MPEYLAKCVNPKCDSTIMFHLGTNSYNIAKDKISLWCPKCKIKLKHQIDSLGTCIWPIYIFKLGPKKNGKCNFTDDVIKCNSCNKGLTWWAQMDSNYFDMCFFREEHTHPATPCYKRKEK